MIKSPLGRRLRKSALRHTMHRLYRGQHNRSFQNVTDSDVVKKIAEEAGIQIKTPLDNSGEPHDYLFQENQTNMAFLRDRASRIGFELFNQDGKLHFRKPKPGNELALKWLKNLSSFRVRVSSAEQVKEVEVRAWDYGEKRAIVSTKRTDEVITQTDNGKGSDTSTKFNGKPTKPKRIIVDRPVFNPKEADAIAQAVCNELSGQFVCADAKAEGNPKIRPGRVVKLEGMGQHSGKYYVTETRHLYYERVYTTEFSVRGLRGGDLLTTLAPKPTLQPGQTHLVGIVTDNNDPKGWGRVKVKFPTLTEDHTSNWARVVSIGAGHQRGFDCLPEINDEVLVAFEHGDIHRPYVIGGVWTGKDNTPTPVKESVKDGKVRLRTIKTRTGHTIQFIEEDQEGIYIETNGGHKIHLNDSDRSITISSIGTLKIEAPGNIDIKAGGIITVQGRLIKLN
ncbi:VgrG-related protein [Phormidesmis sp. 146-33]